MLTFSRACVMVLMLGMVSSPLTSADERLKDIACRSVHLGYPAAEGLAFYNEIRATRVRHGSGGLPHHAGAAMEALARKGRLVLAVDLGGWGETAAPSRRGGYRPSDQEAMLAYLLGKSLVGLRTEQVLGCAQFLADYGRKGAPRKVHLAGVGAAGVPALHAAALEPLAAPYARFGQPAFVTPR